MKQSNQHGETIQPKAIKPFSPNTFFSYTSKFPIQLLNMYFYINQTCTNNLFYQVWNKHFATTVENLDRETIQAPDLILTSVYCFVNS